MTFEEGDTMLCTVDRIEGTNVFVSIEGGGEGIIQTSEIAAGRIRNLRDYVVPKKKIVCKVLRISENRIELSLRRVNQKEQKEVLEQYKVEKSFTSILNTILGQKSAEVIKKINEKGRLYIFFENINKNEKEFEEIVGKEDAKKILEIINSQKQKIFIVKKDISLKTTKSNGLEIIKNILEKIKGIEIKYISAGHYSLKSESLDIKSADNLLKNIISEIEKLSKKEGIEFNIIEK
jgi:translation initiation factor 2 alpha subunit (eIF-2alpha)